MEVLHALDDLSSIVAGPWLIETRAVFIHIIDVIPIGTSKEILIMNSKQTGGGGLCGTM